MGEAVTNYQILSVVDDIAIQYTNMHRMLPPASPVKLMLKNSLVTGAMFNGLVCVAQIPFWGFIQGEVSSRELGYCATKSVSCAVIGTGVGVGANYVGAEVGAMIGTAIVPGAGTAVGLIGGFVAGYLTGKTISYVASWF